MKLNVFPFPTPEDLDTIQILIKNFLTAPTGLSRRMMLRTIARVLERYSVSQFKFIDFTVETSRERYATIQARNFTRGRTCPGCGEPVYPPESGVRILSIKEAPREHMVTYGCRCGRIFGKHEPV